MHSDDLRALNAQTHVSAGQNYSVLGCGVANNALSLRVICDVGCVVVDTVDVIQVKDRVVVLYTDININFNNV